MADFKILGNTDPVITNLGDMTQGIGYPLRPVEPAVSGGAVTVRVDQVLNVASIVDQDPAGLGTPMQVVFEEGVSTPQFQINPDGSVLCLITDEYEVTALFSVGRSGAAGVSQIYIRALIDGVQEGFSRHTIMDTDDFEISLNFARTLEVTAGQVVTFEVARDTDGNNSGGLRAGVPDIAWNPSPSAHLIINRTVAVTP